MLNNNNFAGLRLISALLVLFSHQFALSGRWEPRLIGDHSYGNIGVLCFFAMSGYLISISWHNDPHPIRFLIKRFLRIAPGLTVMLATSYAVTLFFHTNDFINNPITTINGSLWTIPLEILSYLLFLIIAQYFTQIPIIFLTVMLISWWLTGGQNTHFYLAYFGLFFGMGTLLNQFPNLHTKGATFIFFSISIVILTTTSQTILGLLFILPHIVIIIGTNSWRYLRNAEKWGDLSYGIYIYAWPIQQLFVLWFDAKSDYFTLLIPSLIVTLILAYLSWHLIENPLLRIKPLKSPSTRCSSQITHVENNSR